MSVVIICSSEDILVSLSILSASRSASSALSIETVVQRSTADAQADAAEPHGRPVPGPHPWRPVVKDMEEKFPRALWVRLFVYLIAGHIFAAFIYLLFEVGAK